MFGILCGEGNISPEYFYTELSFHEANILISGIRRRYRTTWECARWQTTFIAKCAGNKDYQAPTFWWEDDNSVCDAPTTEEMAQLEAEGQAWAARLNNRHQ